MSLSNLLRSSLAEAVSLESIKLDGDVNIGAPQTLITLRDALMSAEEDLDESTHVDEEIAEFETVADSLESLRKMNNLYIRDGGMTPELARVYSKTFDRLIGQVGIESLGISKVSLESFALDPMVASLEAAEETAVAKASVMERLFTKAKLFGVKLGDFLTSYQRVGKSIQAAVEEIRAELSDGGPIPADLMAKWKAVNEISSRMDDFTNRSRMEVASMQNAAKSGDYHAGDYKSAFEGLSKSFVGEVIPGGGQFSINGKAILRFKSISSEETGTVEASTSELLSLLKSVSAAAQFIGTYSELLKGVEAEIAKSIVAAEKRMGGNLSEAFVAYIHDINSIMNCVRGPGPDYLSFLGNLCRETLSHVKSASK